MATETLLIELDGAEAPELNADLLGLEVELGGDIASMACLTVKTRRLSDGSWLHIDDERFGLFMPLAVQVGFDGAVEPLFKGYITHVQTVFGREEGQCHFEIWAMDGSCLMDRSDSARAWPDSRDSDIARQLFAEYQLTPVIEDTGFVRDAELGTLIQRESDIRFLRRLALRNGYECYVDGASGYFRPSVTTPDQAQPVLSAHFGADTTLLEFSVEINAMTATRVSATHIDRLNKELVEAEVDDSGLDALGATGHSDLLPAGIQPGHTLAAAATGSGALELETLCRGIFRRGDWFVHARGTVAARRYAHVLKPWLPVLVKGVGNVHSGLYYVTKVGYSLSRESNRFLQRFEAKRNALEPSGSEDFEGAGNVLGLL